MGSIEDRATQGISAAKEAFFATAKDHNEEIEGIKLYKPTGFTISDKSDKHNIIFKRRDETFLLFINPNEEEDSHLFHELLLSDNSKKIIAEETFTKDGTFGFAAVMNSDNENVEIVASVGGVKMTTITKEKRIVDDLAYMMEVVRSIK